MNINNVIAHARDREYMSGVNRNQSRVKSTGEVFTPTELVQELLDGLDQDLFINTAKTFIDPTCGDGQFLSEVLIRKLEALGKEDITDNDFEQALSTIYGVDLMEDNVKLCRERLLCNINNPAIIAIVNKNIVHADALRYHYRFDNSHPYDDEKIAMEQEKNWNSLFA